MKALVGAFNQEKALVGAFSLIVQLHRLIDLRHYIFYNYLWCSVPRVSSVRWLLKLYSVVLAGLGLILSLSWTCFHLYVLSVTSLPELRQHRCRIIQILSFILILLDIRYYSERPFWTLLHATKSNFGGLPFLHTVKLN